jgi:hypothetical protein
MSKCKPVTWEMAADSEGEQMLILRLKSAVLLSGQRLLLKENFEEGWLNERRRQRAGVHDHCKRSINDL